MAADILSLTPADDSLYASRTDNLVITFDEDVSVGSGQITINDADGNVFEAIDVTDVGKVTVEGAAVTINPGGDLAADTSYSIQFDPGAFVNKAAKFSEGFEGLELLPLESTSETGGDGTDWTDALPEGWERDNGDTPDTGPIEFFGFSVFDKNSWIETAGNQDRANFTRGSGNVVVADPDEYDDLGDIDDTLFNVFLTSPEIALDGVPANSATLEFDSSFRPYPSMVGLVDVSFDGGATWDNVLTLNDDTVEGGTSSLARANVTESLDLENPAGGNVHVRFGMVDAGNDWWWAIDNILVTAPGTDEVAGIADNTTWNFHTFTPPAFAPADDSADVAVTSSLVLTFSRDVVTTPGLGNLEIRRAEDDSLFEAVAMASDRVTVSGATVTIDPEQDLEADTAYYVLIDDITIWDTEAVQVSDITLFAEDFEGLPLQDSVLVGNTNIDDYVVVMSGLLDVKVAGDYTFGGNSDDGQLLAIDVAQDGLDLLDDEIIFDNTAHGNQDRLSVCGADFAEQSCVGDSDDAITLSVGQYAFEYWYFERGGGSSGEFFYAPGKFEVYVAGEFALVGDDSKGIGVTADGITATTYKSAADQITSLDPDALDLVDGFIDSAEGFPVSEKLPTADIYNTGGTGRFNDNHALPGYALSEAGEDWSPEAPAGWTREADIPDGAQPEFNGWTFLNKDFWIAQQGNQARDTFVKGDNVLAVSDPDAVDDFVNIDPNLYNDVFLTTPEIPLDGVAPNSVALQFDSSFRPYETMIGLVDVSFDGGASWDNLLFMNEDTVEGGNSSLARANATEVLQINNPSSGTVQFRWGMTNSGNDWWWAIDNIRVTAPFPGNPLPGISDADTWNFTTGTGSQVEPIPGDIDGDGTVAFADFLILSSTFGSTVDPPGSGGDIDGNGIVGFSDFLILSANFGQSSNPAPVAAAPQSGPADAFFAIATSAEDDDAFAELDLEDLL